MKTFCCYLEYNLAGYRLYYATGTSLEEVREREVAAFLALLEKDGHTGLTEADLYIRIDAAC